MLVFDIYGLLEKNRYSGFIIVLIECKFQKCFRIIWVIMIKDKRLSVL